MILILITKPRYYLQNDIETSIFVFRMNITNNEIERIRKET